MWSARCRGFANFVPAPVRRRELPSRHASVMISLGEPLSLVGPDGDRSRAIQSFVTGLQTTSAITERVGHYEGMHLELPPLTARALLGVPMHTLTDRLVDLSAIFGSSSASVIDELATAPTWTQRFDRLSNAIADRLRAASPPTPVVAWAWRRLRSAHGAVRIDDLVAEAGCSHRHLATRFQEEVGLTPKVMARLMRFERTIALARRPASSWAAIAVDAGYYDQSHLNREFRVFAGQPPSAHRHGVPAGCVPAAEPRSEISKTTAA